MSYTKGTTSLASDYNTLAGLTGSAAGSSAAATGVAGYLWGIGYGDRGYGQSVPTLTALAAGKVDAGADWANLRTVLANLASWQNTSSTLLPPSANLSSGYTGAAYPAGGSPYAIPDLLATLDTNRFNYQAGNMTLTSSATSSTRATTWGQSGGSITCELSTTFASEDQARFFFNSGGEIRIALAHPSSVTTRDADWQAVLNNLVVAFRANSSAKLSGSYGTANAVGYYQLTTSYQPILNFTSGFISPYTTNTFSVSAKAVSITGANGAKGYQIYFQVVLNDTYYTAQDNTVVQAGTNAVLSHLRATSTVVVAAPTCALVTSF